MILVRPASLKKTKRVGRGGDRGKTSGRGHKGQRARAGHKVRPHTRDELQRIPKRRGFSKNRAQSVWVERPRPQCVTLARLLSFCDIIDCSKKITPEVCIKNGICKKIKGKIPSIKIIGNVEKCSQVLHIKKCQVTPNAKKIIIEAGGTVTL